MEITYQALVVGLVARERIGSDNYGHLDEQTERLAYQRNCWVFGKQP